MTTPRILLVGDSETRPAGLTERLIDWGGRCRFSSSRADASLLVQSESFDLVLSRMRLPDGNAFQLVPLFEGGPTTLFAYLSARDGCWWLPLVKSGSKCEHGPALQYTEFLKVLQQAVENGSGVSSQLVARRVSNW
jgi:hypothetical protein